MLLEDSSTLSGHEPAQGTQAGKGKEMSILRQCGLLYLAAGLMEREL